MTRTTPRTNLLFTTVACAFSLTLADVAAAQTTAATAPSTTTGFSPGHWTVTPFIGVGFSGDVDSATGALGAAAGYVWSDRMSFEGEFNVLPSSEANGVVEVATTVWSLTGNVLYHFSRQTLVPYGVVGIGYGHASADLGTSTLPNVDTSSSEFVLNFGGGVERRWTERLAVRGDLRYFFGGDLVPDYWRLSGGVTFDIRRR
jgi:opacity protein-like surface antigen